MQSLELKILDKKKLILTINNLKDSDKSIKFYVDKNLNKALIFQRLYFKSKFFNQSHEIIFRSLTKIIQRLGKKYYPVRGKSINELIKGINTKSFSKVTRHFIDRVNETILISKEN